MKFSRFNPKQFIVGVLLLAGWLGGTAQLVAQPVVSYTVTGAPGQYHLNFTVNNTAPGSGGFDIYFFGVLANGSISGSPAGYNPTSYAEVHRLEVGTVADWQFNQTWIDPTYTRLPTGRTLSGFTLLAADPTPPLTIPYFAYGTHGGAIYTGPDNQNTGNPSNPLFVGYAVPSVPEPAVGAILLGAMGLWLRRHTRPGTINLIRNH